MQMPIFLQLTNIQILPMMIFLLVALLFGFRYRKIVVYFECFLITLGLSLYYLAGIISEGWICWLVCALVSVVLGVVCANLPHIGLGMWAGIYLYAILENVLGMLYGIIIGLITGIIVFYLVGKYKKRMIIILMSYLSGFRLIYLVIELLSLSDKEYAGIVYLIGTLLLGTIGVLVQRMTSVKRKEA